jgi:hypothetical protein
MNQAQKIKHWIDAGCIYKDGVALYNIYGGNNTLKGLFDKFSTRFYQDKLYQELIGIKVAFEKMQVITPVSIQAKAVAFEDLPDKLKRMDREKSDLFRRIIQSRHALKKYVTLKTNGRISMADALNAMAERDRFKRLKPFSITYISYNKTTDKGGEVLHYPSCYLRVVNNTGSRVKKGDIHYSSKQPSHWKNSTRNFEPIGSGQVKKFHIWLLIEFNGMEVVTSELG